MDKLLDSLQQLVWKTSRGIKVEIPEFLECHTLDKLDCADLRYFKFRNLRPAQLVLRVDTPKSEALVGSFIPAVSAVSVILSVLRL